MTSPLLPIPNGGTTVTGIIGHPVGHSRSPQMHTAAFAALGLNWIYVPFPVAPEALEQAVMGLAAAGVVGLNVTIPHKTGILPLLDDVSPAAAGIGAVNTVVMGDGWLVGHNTDGIGFYRALLASHPFDPTQGRGLILGAGGSAHAVCDQLAREGMPVLRIRARNPSRAAALAERVREHHPACDAQALNWSDDPIAAEIDAATLIINTTPLGMQPDDALPLDMADITAGITAAHTVSDLIYSPRETPFLSACRARGSRVVNGEGMLLHQGAESFTLWTGQPAPVAAMAAALGLPEPPA